MLHYLMMGTILGLSAGFSPGPLLTLVITQTLKHNVGAGIKVALAPLITDIPIVALSFFVLSQLTNFESILGIISLCGGCFVFYLGVQNIRTKPIEFNFTNESPKSLTKGILTNVLSPHPYIFWIAVGLPIMNQSLEISWVAAMGFVITFYVWLIGSKVILALLVGRSRGFLKERGYINTMRLLGILLCGLALMLFYDAFERLMI